MENRTIIAEFNLMMLGYIRFQIYFDGKSYKADFDGVSDGSAEVVSDTKIISKKVFNLLYDWFVEASKDNNTYDVNTTSQYSVYIGTSIINENDENQIEIEYDSTERSNFSPMVMQEIMNYIAEWDGVWRNFWYSI